MKRARIAGVLCACFIAAAAAGCGGAGSEKTMEGMQLIQQMDYEGAHASFEAAAANGEDMQMICRGQGIAYMGQTDYANAVENLEMALTYSGPVPEDLDYDINYYLASAYYRNGQLSEALGVYEAITALRPQEKTAWYLKGTIELEQGATEAAKADFDKAIEIDRTDFDQYVDIYRSCSKYGQETMGKEYLETVLADESLRLSDYDKGRMYFYLGDYEQARLSLESAKDSSGAEATSLLGQTYENLGDYNYAASVYSTYLETRQPDASIYNQLGICKLKVGDYTAALDAFQAGLAIDGNTVMQSLQFNEIVAYEYLGQFENAKIAMGQYLALYPDDQKAQQEYVFLQTR